MNDKYVVEPGVMLYDSCNQLIGWIVGKRRWFVDSDGKAYDWPYNSKDWDVEWNNGRTEYLSESSLQIFILNFLRFQNEQ
jgi:hypothetical protein